MPSSDIAMLLIIIQLLLTVVIGKAIEQLVVANVLLLKWAILFISSKEQLYRMIQSWGLETQSLGV